jgi:hypothetical protein
VSRSAAVIAVLAIFAVAVLSACGSSDSGGSTSTADTAAATSSTQAAPAAASTTEPAAAPAGKHTAAIVAECHKMFDPYTAKLLKLRASVDGTLKYRTFAATTTKLTTAYNAFDEAAVPSPTCQTTVGQPTGGAFLQYALATGTLSTCRKRHSCTSVKAELEHRWTLANVFLTNAREGYTTVTTS